MASFMAPLNNYTYAVLRIVTGLLFMFHGSQKLLGWPVPPMDGMPPFITYIAGPIELIGGALVMVGLMTRWAAFVCSGLMAAAYWMAHGTQGAVSDAERRRTRDRVLLRVPVHLVAWSRASGASTRCEATR